MHGVVATDGNSVFPHTYRIFRIPCVSSEAPTGNENNFDAAESQAVI